MSEYETFIANTKDIRPFLPELPDAEASDVFDKIQAYERQLILPDKVNRSLRIADYAEGSASFDDETEVFGNKLTGTLISADHATDPVRKATGVREDADHGTAGLARILAEDTSATSIIPLGRQTGNAATSPDYPIKQKMDRLLPNHTGFLSVHGMKPGKVTDFTDTTEIHGLIGLGAHENESSRQAARNLSNFAKDLGLRVMIGNDTWYMSRDPEDGSIELDDQTQPKTGRLAALGEHSTTNYARKLLDTLGRDDPAFQIELTRILRLVPEDIKGWKPDKKAVVMGVYTGYLLCKKAVEIINHSKIAE